VIIPHVSCPAAGKPDLYLTLNISTSVQGNMLAAGMGYWLVIVFIRALFLGDIGRGGRVSERSVYRDWLDCWSNLEVEKGYADGEELMMLGIRSFHSGGSG